MDLEDGCNPTELYALSSFKKWNEDSMTAMLLGLCGKELQYPVPDAADMGFTVSLPSKDEDYILGLRNQTCKRSKNIKKAIEKASAT